MRIATANLFGRKAASPGVLRLLSLLPLLLVVVVFLVAVSCEFGVVAAAAAVVVAVCTSRAR